MTGMLQASVALLSSSVSRRAGGVVAPMRAIAPRVVAVGGQAHVYALNDPDLPKDLAGWGAIPVHAVNATFRRASFAPRLDHALLERKHDLLHLHGLWLYPSLATSKWRRRTGGSVIISPHGMLDPWALRNSAWKKRAAMALFERKNLAGAACLHALNASEAASIRALGLDNPVAVIPNGVDLPADTDTPSRPGFLAGDDRKALLFLGRIHPKKGVSETIEAWALAKAAKPALSRDWVLVVAGWDDGGHLDAAKAKARALGLERDVIFPGALFGPEKEAALAHAGAFVLASYSEGLPIAVLEAWAHGAPVFMTQACNLPEGFAAGAAVEIAPEPANIADAFLERLGDPALAMMGTAGRHLVEARFTWSRVAQDLVAVYRWLVHGGAAPPSVQTS